jgi:AraC-like DNA-binding protein
MRLPLYNSWLRSVTEADDGRLTGVDNSLSVPAKGVARGRMHGMYTALPTVGQLIWRWIELHGISAKELFAAQGIAEQDLQPQRDRIAIDELERVLASALSLIDDNCCGLRASRCWHPSDLGALGYAWLASSSIRAAVQRLVRYSKTVGEKAELAAVESPQGFKVILDQKHRDPRVHEFMTDFIMSLIIDMCRFNAGASLRPVEVCLHRERPECAKRYTDFYGCEVQFSSEADSFTLTTDDADRPLPTSNKQLAGLHDQVLIQQLAQLHREDISTRCKSVILDNLTSGAISVEKVAQELHMSPRTLMRRLESQGTKLKSLVDEMRSELASRYLADPKNSITEVAFLLGFSHPSSLSRASHRWFGMSPIEFRSTQFEGPTRLG